MKNENYVYPIRYHVEAGAFVIEFPDFPMQTLEVETEAEVVKKSQETLALLIMELEDEGKEIPKSIPIEKLRKEDGERIIYVHLWMPYFRKDEKVEYVKKTLTIPAWLDQLAKGANINFSSVLVKGLKESLGINSDH